MAEITLDMLKARVYATQAEMARQMNINMYGDREPPRVLSRRERVFRYISVRRERIHDAWLVLTGKADIGY